MWEGEGGEKEEGVEGSDGGKTERVKWMRGGKRSLERMARKVI